MNDLTIVSPELLINGKWLLLALFLILALFEKWFWLLIIARQSLNLIYLFPNRRRVKNWSTIHCIIVFKTSWKFPLIYMRSFIKLELSEIFGTVRPLMLWLFQNVLNAMALLRCTSNVFILNFNNGIFEYSTSLRLLILYWLFNFW